MVMSELLVSCGADISALKARRCPAHQLLLRYGMA